MFDSARAGVLPSLADRGLRRGLHLLSYLRLGDSASRRETTLRQTGRVLCSSHTIFSELAMDMGDGVIAANPSTLVDFVAGTAGGMASLLVGQPFDTIKTRLQAQGAASTLIAHTLSSSSPSSPLVHQSSAVSSSPRLYRSATDALGIIVREESFLGLFKGVSGPILGVAAMNASIFGSYGLALRFQCRKPSDKATLWQTLLAGCASGVVSALITSPIELVKIREQVDTSGTGAQPQPLKVIKQLWNLGGLFGPQGLYRGFGVTCLRDLGYGPYFLCYEIFNRLLSSLHQAKPIHGEERSMRLSNAELAVSGALGGVIAWLSTFPIDCIKTRMQASSAPELSISRAAREIWTEGGFCAFWSGVGPTVLRAIPVNAVLFVVYEATKDALIAQRSSVWYR